MTNANECTCPSGDGSLRHPCPAHPASVELAGVAANLTFINGRPAMCGCQVEYSSGGGEYSDVIYVTLCAKHSGSAILDLVATNRIALTPEYEGQWHADLYLDREIPLAKAEGATPAEAVLALMSAERIDPEQESVEQAGGDERAAFRPAQVISYRPGVGEVTIYVAGRVPGYMNIGDTVYVSDRAPVDQPSAALAQPSPVSEALIYACKNLAQITSSDGSGHADIAMAVLRMAGVGDDERERLVNEWKAARAWKPSPGQAEKATADDYEEVLADHRRLVRELDVLLNGEDGAAKQASLCDLVGQVSAIVRERRVPLLSRSRAEDAPVIGCLCGMPMTEGHHSPDGCCNLEEFAPQTQAEQAEAERPVVIARLYRSNDLTMTPFAEVQKPLPMPRSDGTLTVEPLMTVAQHDRIVGALRAVIAQLRQHKNDYMDSGQETYRALQNEIREREAEIARLDGLVSGRTAERDAALAEVEADRDLVKIMQEQIDALRSSEEVALARVAELEHVLRVVVNAADHGSWPTTVMHGIEKVREVLAGSAPPAKAQHSVPEGVTIERDVAGTIHIKVGDFDFIQLQYQRPYTDNASTWKLAERIASLLAAAPGKEGV